MRSSILAGPQPHSLPAFGQLLYRVVDLTNESKIINIRTETNKMRDGYRSTDFGSVNSRVEQARLIHVINVLGSILGSDGSDPSPIMLGVAQP